MTDETNAAAIDENANNQNQPVKLALQKIFVKDLSLEVPNAPDVFEIEYKPEVKLELNSRTRNTAEHRYEVEVTVSVTATQNDTTLYVAEVQQAGIFEIQGVNDPMKMRHALSAYCPNILFPYIRETISSLTTRGGFPPLMLAPVNFDQLFAQQIQREQAQAQQSEVATDSSAIQ